MDKNSASGDVVLEVVNVRALLCHEVFHDIANTDQASEFVVFEHGQIASPLVGH